MSDLPERILEFCKGRPAKIPWPHRIVHEAHDEIIRCRREADVAATEIVRLREGLRDLRYGMFKDTAAVNEFIDGLLKVEKVEVF